MIVPYYSINHIGQILSLRREVWSLREKQGLEFLEDILMPRNCISELSVTRLVSHYDVLGEIHSIDFHEASLGGERKPNTF